MAAGIFAGGMDRLRHWVADTELPPLIAYTDALALCLPLWDEIGKY